MKLSEYFWRISSPSHRYRATLEVFCFLTAHGDKYMVWYRCTEENVFCICLRRSSILFSIIRWGKDTLIIDHWRLLIGRMHNVESSYVKTRMNKPFSSFSCLTKTWRRMSTRSKKIRWVTGMIKRVFCARQHPKEENDSLMNIDAWGNRNVLTSVYLDW